MKNYDHQERIVKDDRKYTGLFTGTGSGKTRAGLLLARGDTLVIAPKTQREDKNWERGLAMLVKDPDAPVPELESLTVISKEDFRRDWDILPYYETLIGDEAHTLLGVTPNIKWVKTGKAYVKEPVIVWSQTFDALDKYIQKHRPKRLYLATATIMRSPMTVWAAAKLLGKQIDWYKFRAEYYVQLPMPGRTVFKPRDDNETKDKLAALVRELGYVGRLEDFFDVPAQTFKTIYVPLTGAQKKRIKEIPLQYPEPIVQLGKVHQIENNYLLGDKFNKPEPFEGGKLDALSELALEFPRMVVFAKYTAQIDTVAAHLRSEGYKVLTMTGETQNRGQLILEANKALSCIFICQAQISAGWELPEYPVMVFASMTYSFVDYDQALGRIQRANNIKKNLYIKLVMRPEFEGTGKKRRLIGGVDAAVEKSIANKQNFNERIYLKGI